MRAYYVLLAATVALLVTTDAAASTTTDLESSAGAIQASGDPRRFLRATLIKYDDTDDDNDDQDEDSEEEERGLTNGASEKVAGTASKLTKTASGVKTVDELPELVRLATKVWSVKGQNNVLFKRIQSMGTTPDSMAQTLGIAKKLETIPKAKLADDANYMLWVHYSSYWKKFVSK